MSFLEKIFGSYSKKEIKKIEPIVDKIEKIEETLKKLTDEQLVAKTQEFKNMLKENMDKCL